MLQGKSGCDVCRGELESFEHPHLVNVFANDVPRGDLGGIGQHVIIQAPHNWPRRMGTSNIRTTSCISALRAGHSGFNNTGRSRPQKQRTRNSVTATCVSYRSRYNRWP